MCLVAQLCIQLSVITTVITTCEITPSFVLPDTKSIHVAEKYIFHRGDVLILLDYVGFGEGQA